MFSHVTVGCDDLEAAGRFYDAVLAQLDLVRREVASDGGLPALCWVAREHTLPRFYVYRPFDGLAAAPGNGAITAFLAHSPATVDAAHAAGLAAAAPMRARRANAPATARATTAPTYATRAATGCTSRTAVILNLHREFER